MVNFGTLHWVSSLLSLAGSVCFLWCAILLTGAKPMKTFRTAWAKLKAGSKNLQFAWPVVDARIRGLTINFMIALVFFALGWLWRGHAYNAGVRSNYARDYEAWKQRSIDWQRTYADFKAKHKELTNDNEIRRFSTTATRTTASTESRSAQETN